MDTILSLSGGGSYLMYYLAWSLPPLLALAGVCLYHDTY